MAVMASETFTSTCAPIQYAAVRAFKRGNEIEEYLWRSRWILEALGKKISEVLNKNGIYTPIPDGAFYCFPDFSDLSSILEKKAIKTSSDLCTKLLEDTGVAILPGEAFGRPVNELTARIAYVDFDGVKTMSAALHLKNKEDINEEFIRVHCGEMLKAIELICDWVKSA